MKACDGWLAPHESPGINMDDLHTNGGERGGTCGGVETASWARKGELAGRGGGFRPRWRVLAHNSLHLRGEGGGGWMDGGGLGKANPLGEQTVLPVAGRLTAALRIWVGKKEKRYSSLPPSGGRGTVEGGFDH